MSLDHELIAGAHLASITLGGEIVDQSILDRLKTLFPKARIRHIYASSEVGAAIIVTDGMAGFDADLVHRPGGTVQIRVEGNRLFLRSPYAAGAGANDWIDTGDSVELRADRYHFLGRAEQDIVNIGGQKASLRDIEARLMAHPDVIWARVSARRAPLVGNLPVASVVLASGRPDEDSERILIEHCQSGLADFAVPRMWEFLDVVPMRDSLKS